MEASCLFPSRAEGAPGTGLLQHSGSSPLLLQAQVLHSSVLNMLTWVSVSSAANQAVPLVCCSICK